MNKPRLSRRSFIKTGSVALGAGLVPGSLVAERSRSVTTKRGQAKNIIFLVSDGMSSGAFAMADHYCENVHGRSSYWKQAMLREKARQSSMHTHSNNSLVTDSAAAASAWGCGHKVNNGSLNVLPDGSDALPIFEEAKRNGKAIGVVTTATATHATPAGFLVNNKSRQPQREIAQSYYELQPEVIMGGGTRYFGGDEDLQARFVASGYTVAGNKNELEDASVGKPILGLFADSHLPYAIDRKHDGELAGMPGLVEMTKKALAILRQNKEGFALQVEAARVDHAAHANDVGGLLYDQLEFDDVIAVVDEFVKEEPDTLVIITTDHGNANPGLMAGGSHLGANRSFAQIENFKISNASLLARIRNNNLDDSKIGGEIKGLTGLELTEEELKMLSAGLREEGTEAFRVRNSPLVYMGQVFSNHTAVGWVGTSHTSDLCPLTAYGPGAELFPLIHDNIDVHTIMRRALGFV